MEHLAVKARALDGEPYLNEPVTVTVHYITVIIIYSWGGLQTNVLIMYKLNTFHQLLHQLLTSYQWAMYIYPMRWWGCINININIPAFISHTNSAT